jgi:hypothetical protein
VLTVLGAVGLTYWYQDDIEQLLVEQINQQLKGEVIIEDLEFSAIKKFPYASLELKEVSAIDAFDQDTLLRAEKLFLKFNALDLYNGNYLIQQLELEKGLLQVLFDAEGKPNYEIWHKRSDSTSSSKGFGLEEVLLREVQLIYIDRSFDISADAFVKESKLSLTMEEGELSLQLSGGLQANHLDVSQLRHLHNQPIDLWLSLNREQKNLRFNGVLNVPNVALKVQGEYINKNLSLDVNGEQLSLSDVFAITPKRYLKSIDPYQLEGKIDFDLHLENEAQSKRSPFVEVVFELAEGQMTATSNLQLTSMDLKGVYNNGSSRSSRSSVVKIDHFKGMMNKVPVEGGLSLTDFSNPSVKTNFKTNTSLDQLSSFGIVHSFEQLAASLSLSASYEGKIGLKNDFATDFIQASKTADITLAEGSMTYSPQYATLSDFEASLRLVDNALFIDSLQAKAGKESSFSLQAAAEQFVPYLLADAKLKLGGYLQSDWLLVDELWAADSAQSKKEAFQMPTDIQLNIQASLKDVSYGRFHMRNGQTKISMNKGELKVSDLSLETMSGKISGDLSFTQVADGRLRMLSTSHLEDINVRQLFYEFNNFGQSTMRHKHLRGVMVADVYLRSEWDAYMNPLTENMYSFIDVKIGDGELIDFEPMMMMSDYISVEELKRIKFSTLENQIEIKNKQIEFPFMEIHSSAIDIAGSGTHSFSNEMNYEFKLLLNEILSNKFRRKNKKQASEFGDVMDDGVKGMTMFLKMEGTVDDPKISYNTLRLRESLSEGFKQEKKELKDALKQEFGDYDEQDNTDKNLNDSPDYNNLLEDWE